MNFKEIENGILHIYSNDPLLARIIDMSDPCDLSPKRKHYLTFLRSIINQQLSSKSAAAIYKRFLALFNNNPDPEKLLETPAAELRKLGISNPKIKYIKDFSEKIIIGEIHFRGLNKMSDNEIIEEFTKVKGIGSGQYRCF